ncbi:MAG: polyprenyl synthetase family protein [Planctomycetales bacterium]|nr:polyprenyl synthetase family protein [Planctomycetales bacterium]
MPESSTAAVLQQAREMRTLVDAALDRYTQFDADCPANLRDAIRHSLLAPCKRLRPVLVLMAAEACGCSNEAAMPAACAVEMIHTYSLIHDDLPAMDDDDMRRGLPSCHAKYGEATAILAGDALLALAFEVMAAGIEPADRAARCCRELAQAAGATALVGGQADDLAAENGGGGLEHLEAIHRRKTGAMFRVSLRLGGVVAGANETTLRNLDCYGENLGLAFQIVDDLLDLHGDEAALGKRAQKDAGRGKLTFPSLLGEEESRRRAVTLVDRACEAVSEFGSRAGGLESLARYVLERNH